MFQKIGKFEIKKLLGHGAMGEVYLGVDPSIGREVAIKTIHPNAAQGAESKQRFAREAKAAGILNHPNLVTIYEFGEDQDLLYIAMEYIPGHDLEEFLREGTLSQSDLLEVLAQVCDGLAFAHSKGIVHRDIKPSNVRVTRDGKRLVAKVTDFGVARISNSEMTATGMVMGTVSYMAPEYIRTGKPDSRSDLFAVGVMLYEGLSGRKPFSGDTTPTILYKIVNETPEPIDSSTLHGISPAVRSVLDRSLVKDPEQRYQAADEFARALRAAKDPTWSGQVAEVLSPAPAAADRTVQVSPPTQALAAAPMAMPPAAPGAPPPLPATPPLPQPAAARPTAPPRPSSSKAVPILLGLAAGVILLAGLGYGAWRYLGRKPAEEAVAAQTSAVSAAPPETPVPAMEVPPPSTPSTGTVSPTSPAPPHAANPPLNSRQPEAPAKATPPAVEKRNLPPSDERFDSESLRSLSAPERKSLSSLTMSESIALADSSPDKALEGLRNAIAANPTNANAYAWTVAILYEQGRYREIPAVFARARQHGITRAQMAANLRFRMAMQNESLNRRIPGGPGGGEE